MSEFRVEQGKIVYRLAKHSSLGRYAKQDVLAAISATDIGVKKGFFTTSSLDEIMSTPPITSSDERTNTPPSDKRASAPPRILRSILEAENVITSYAALTKPDRTTTLYDDKTTLIIGLGTNDDISFDCSKVLFTGIRDRESLKWIDLTVKKCIPNETFTTILIYSPSFLFTNGGILDPRKISTVLSTLKSTGELQVMDYRDSTTIMFNDYLYKLGYEKVFRRTNNICGSPAIFNIFQKKTQKSEQHPSRGSNVNAPIIDDLCDKIEEMSVTIRPPGNYQILGDISFNVTKKAQELEKPRTTGITLVQFRAEIDKDEFIESFVNSAKSLFKYKATFYKEKLVETQKDFDRIQTKVRTLQAKGLSHHNIKEIFPMYDFYAGFILNLEDLIRLVLNRAENINAVEIRKSLIEALEHPTRGFASIVGRQDIKDSLVSQLYAFSKSHKTFINAFNNICLMGPAGVGKCLAVDTPILMYDGTIKLVQDIVVGDVIMGDDSTPRNVLGLGRGVERMYQIIPEKGDSYIVNESHILSLTKTNKYSIAWLQERNAYRVEWCNESRGSSGSGDSSKSGRSFSVNDYGSKKNTKAAVLSFISSNPLQDFYTDIELREYIKKPLSWKKEWKGYRVGVDFHNRHNVLSIDPYVLGFWLGGKLELGVYYDDVLHIFSEEDIRTHLEEYDMLNNEHIPFEYLTSTRDVRLKILAGLIDSNGCLVDNCYSISQKSKRLTDDILYIARSLGFAAYAKKYTKSYLNKMEVYYKITISGRIFCIPILDEQKRLNEESYTDDVLKVGITVKPLDEDRYYGFQIDGNHRFVLGDFTVTHNTALAKVIGFVFSKSGILATDTVKIISPRADLVGQYVGHTAPRTRACLFECLESVLFIDEAYQLSSTGTEKDFGPESVTEIVNFLDKYIGMNIVIVAGYEDRMMKQFFPSNEGLSRRFPFRLLLQKYSTCELTDILSQFIERGTDMKIDENTGNWLFSAVSHLSDKFSEDGVFANQAGDMLNLGASIIKSINSSYAVKWIPGDLFHNIPILMDGLNDYLITKGLTVS